MIWHATMIPLRKLKAATAYFMMLFTSAEVTALLMTMTMVSAMMKIRVLGLMTFAASAMDQ